MSLKRSEWPGNVLDYMTHSIIDLAINARIYSGVPMVPSPLEEAHVRFVDGTSRHAVGVDGTSRKSDGTDLFVVKNIDAPKLWRCLSAMSGVGGLGVYFDTILGGKKRVMFHIDERPERVMWVCPSRDRAVESRSYLYYRDGNPSPFLDVLSAEFERLKRG